MDPLDENTSIELDTFDWDAWIAFLNNQSKAIVIGMGRLGIDTVNTICQSCLCDMNKIDFIIIDTKDTDLQSPDETPTEQNLDLEEITFVIENPHKYLIDNDNLNIDEHIQNAIWHPAEILFVIAEINDIYTAQVISTMCRKFCHDNQWDDHNASIVFPIFPPNDENGGNKVDEDIALIAASASKVFLIKDPGSPFFLQNTCNIINVVCQTFMNTDFCQVKIKDVVSILKSGTKAVYGIGTGNGKQRAEKSAINLMHYFESNGMNVEDIQDILLIFRFSVLHEPIICECFNAISYIKQLIGKKIRILWNGSENIDCNDDSLTLEAIAIV